MREGRGDISIRPPCLYRVKAEVVQKKIKKEKIKSQNVGLSGEGCYIKLQTNQTRNVKCVRLGRPCDVTAPLVRLGRPCDVTAPLVWIFCKSRYFVRY